MKNAAYALGIDLGTSSCKLCLVDETGCIKCVASAGYRTHSPHSGWAEQDPADWLIALRRAAEMLHAQAGGAIKGIICISLTSAAHIGVLMDHEGRALRKALLWSDQRSHEEAAGLAQTCGQAIFEKTCNWPSTSWTLPHFLWVKNHEPGLWESVERAALSKDYLLHHLTSRWVSDPATAVSSMLCNAGRFCWSQELCAMLGLSDSMLPRIAGAGDEAGRLNRQGAAMLGLAEGIPVINGALDSATETFGAGAALPGDFVIRIGTAGGIHVIKKDPEPDRKLLTYPYPLGSLWYSQAGTNSAGSAIAWALRPAGIETKAEPYAAFGALASQAPAGCEGLIFHPYLSGERTPYWDSRLRATFSGASFQHGREHFARAVLEGVAFSLYDAFLTLAADRKIPPAIKIVGGGSRDPLLLSILSSLLKRELHAQKQVDSAYGAALFGLLSLGHAGPGPLKDIPAEDIYLPDHGDAKIYEEGFKMYRRQAEHLQKMYGKK